MTSRNKSPQHKPTYSHEIDHCSSSLFGTESSQGSSILAFYISQIHDFFKCFAYSDSALESLPGVQNTEAEAATIAQALQGIATALKERNAIEQRKLAVYENLLSVFMTKNGMGVSDTVNFDRGPS